MPTPTPTSIPTYILQTSRDWWPLAAQLIGIVVVAIVTYRAAIKGAREGAKVGAANQARLSLAVARRLRYDEALLEILAAVQRAENAIGPWAVERRGGVPSVRDECADIIAKWVAHQRFLPLDSPVRRAYDEAQIGSRRTQLAEAHTRLSNRQAGAQQEVEQIILDIHSAVSIFEEAIHAALTTVTELDE